MFKRLLAFTLAGCLVFDAAPVTSYAAGLQEATAIESDAETEASGESDGEEPTDVSDGDTAQGQEEPVALEALDTESVSEETEENIPAEPEEIEPEGYADSADGQSVSNGNPAVSDGRLSLTKNEEDGSYSFETEDYIINVRPEAGSLFLRFNVLLEAKEQMPDSAYNFPFVVYYRKSGSDATPAEGNVSLSHALGYKSTNYFVAIESGEAYDVYFALKDYTSDHSILGTSEEITLQTEQTDKDVVIHGITQTETDITFDLEANAYMYCYYAPADGSGEERHESVFRGWNDLKLTGLQPGTEYNVQFVNSNSPTVLFETKVTTAESATQVAWQIIPDEDEFGLSVKADVSKYAGTSTYATIHCVYTSVLGEEKDSYRGFSFSGNDVTVAEDGTKSFSAYYTVTEGLLADTEYEVTVWLQIGNVIYGKTTQKVTAPHAAYAEDDIEFTVEQSATNAKTIECKVTDKSAAGGNSAMKAFLYYKREGDEGAYQKANSSNSSSSSAIFYLSQLEYGATYHYVLLVGGIKKELTKAFGAPEVKLTAVDEGKVNAFDFVRTWKVESAEGAEALAEKYYLNLYYLDGNTYQRLGNAVVLNAENNYQAEIKTAASKWLIPDTDYKLKWILGTTATAGTYDAALYTFYETVHTAKANIVIEDAGDTAYDNRQYKVSLAQEDTVNFAESSSALYLYGYIRKAGSSSFRQTSSVALSSSNGFSSSLYLSNLEAGTDYEFSLRSNGSGYSVSEEYAAWTFTTPKDERVLNVDSVSAKLHAAKLNYTLSGILPTGYGYISCYIREKSEGSEWERSGYNRSYSGTAGLTGSYDIDTYKGKELKDNTTYEYQIGFAPQYNATLSQLNKTVAGEFTTAEDMRGLSGVGVSAGYTYAQVGATFEGNNYNVGSYIYLFYREKGADSWLKAPYRYTDQETAEYTRTVDGLNPGTKYEYVIVIANNYSCGSPDDVTEDRRKAAGEFTTRQSAYTLSFAADENKITHNKAVVTVSAKDSTEDDRVEVVLELNNGLSNTITLKRSSGYTQKVTFSDLLGGTEYTITKAVLSVTEDGRKVTIAELPCDYKFTTKAAEVPTSISLSQEKISLNAANTNGSFYEGYNQKTLKAKTEPGTAAADFIWESSNPDVAVVQNGVVRAAGAGEAKITVKSAYDETVTASCDVTVKQYVIGYTAQAGAEPYVYYYNSYGSVYKGGYVDGLGLYEQDETGALTSVPDFQVTTDRTGIVSWDNATGRMQTLSVGTVRLCMEKDGVKASFSLMVTASGKGFAITGFTSNKSAYPAVAGTEADSYILAYTPGITYKAIGEISPSQNFDPSDFTWQSSDENVATVSESGVITPVKAGNVTLTVTPKLFHTLQNRPYIQDKAVITLQIRELPAPGAESIHVLANTTKKIGDVPFPETWGEGWSWKYPNTPLVTNGVYSDNRYEFEAVYRDAKSGTDSRYPCEKTLSVYIGRITGMSVREIATVKGHNHVLEVSDAGSADTLSLAVSPIWQGKASADAYVVDIPEINGLTITKNIETGYYDITAGKAGNYTLNVTIKAKDTNAVLAKTAYKIKAVAQKQAAAIVLKLDESSQTNGVTMNEAGNIIFTAVDDKKDFVLKAVVTDRNGQELDTVLQWKTTDKTVATVTAAKQDTHTANITVKGEGHTVLTATAKDAGGYSVTLNLEVQNHKPRLNTAKATVNIAYDYEKYDGRALASTAGLVEIVPVYGESIKSVKLCDENGQARTDMRADRYSYDSSREQYLIRPVMAEIPTGTFNCKLMVTTDADVEYSYDLKVSVVDKAPSVSAKMGRAANLFFTDSEGTIDLKISGNNQVEYGSAVWEDQSEGVNNGFSMNAYSYTKNNKYVSYIAVAQQPNLRVDSGKLQDTGVETGTLKIKVKGYRKVYTFENFKIKYTYKKPVLVTTSASSNVVPAVGQNSGRFYIYDKSNKRNLYFSEADNSSWAYDELSWDNEEDVALTVSGSLVTYNYAGGTGTKKLTMTLDSVCWREPLKAVHTIKVIKPQAYLTTSQITYNTALKSTYSVGISLKNTYYSINNYTDIVIEGANAASKKLMEDDLFLITASYNWITVQQSDANLMGGSIPAGSYSYKVTPYYENPDTGERMALNTMTLKIKVVNKPVTAKVSPKGTLDLTYGASSTPEDKKNVAVLADPKFSNFGSAYAVKSYRLTGEYSEYFRLNYGYIRYAGKYGYHYYITHNDGSTRKLRAGQAYKLAIEYTVGNTAGETFTVTSNTFSIKPKQTAAKVTVKNNNQTLYAGSTMTRSYQLSVPAYYTISSASGSIDCNKDGKADITVSGAGTLTVRIVDSDAVGASASGKSYSIPITVHLRGRDGVSKDVKTTIKVKVKR
ncbi:MAG: Ig-like domain-containing protein [Acetatifactor sp.]|nr:Ig-like domain-containing protein [Acetatifactor sp.]